MISLKRTIKLALNRLRVLKYRCTLSVLEYLSSHNILVKKHEKNSVNFYPVNGPQDYRTVCIFRCDVNFQYVIHRIISICEKWYYPSWKKDEAKNAILVVCNSCREEFEVRMKAFLLSFIFHPEGFSKSVEIRSKIPYRYCAIEDLPFSNYTEGADLSRPEMKVYTIDLKQADLNMIGKFSSENFQGSSVDRALKRISDDMVRHIENNVENINKLVSSVEETYDLGQFELVPDVLCAKCGSPVIRRKKGGDMFCLNYCYNGDLDLLRRRTSHVEWMKVCEHMRDSIKRIYDNYR